MKKPVNKKQTSTSKKAKAPAKKPVAKKSKTTKAPATTKKPTHGKKPATKPQTVKKTTGKSSSAPKNSVGTAVPTKQKNNVKSTVPKSGTKADYITKNGLTLRPVTTKDLRYAQTDYQKKSKYVIAIKGHQFFSLNGSLADCKAVVRLTQHQTGGKNGKR